MRLAGSADVEAVGDAGGEDGKHFERVQVFLVFVDLSLEIRLNIGVGGGVDADLSGEIACGSGDGHFE